MKLEASLQDRLWSIELGSEKADPAVPEPVVLACDGWEKTVEVRILGCRAGHWILEIDGKIEDVVLSRIGGEVVAHYQGRDLPLDLYDPRRRPRRQSAPQEEGIVSVRTRMPGRVISVLAAVGEEVEPGQGLVVIEAMKMQNELRAPKKGRVIRCQASPGATVTAGELLFEIE